MITGQKSVTQNDTSAKFALDIRAFGVVVLEMLVSVSEHNYKKRTRAAGAKSKSRTSSVCSSDTLSDFTLLPPSAQPPRKPQEHVVTTAASEQAATKARSNNMCTDQVIRLPPTTSKIIQSDETKANRASSTDTYLDPLPTMSTH